MNQICRKKARDVMKTDVARLEVSTSITEAIRILEDLEISGAPVVDASGKLVGMLSARDVTRIEHVRAGRLAPERGEFAMGGPVQDEGEEEAGEDLILAKEDYSPALGGEDTVADWMNPNFVTVDPDDSLRTVCRRMLAEHVHRVVVAKDRKLEGILSSFDVVRLVAECEAKS